MRNVSPTFSGKVSVGTAEPCACERSNGTTSLLGLTGRLTAELRPSNSESEDDTMTGNSCVDARAKFGYAKFLVRG